MRNVPGLDMPIEEDFPVTTQDEEGEDLDDDDVDEDYDLREQLADALNQVRLAQNASLDLENEIRSLKTKISKLEIENHQFKMLLHIGKK